MPMAVGIIRRTASFRWLDVRRAAHIKVAEMIKRRMARMLPRQHASVSSHYIGGCMTKLIAIMPMLYYQVRR